MHNKFVQLFKCTNHSKSDLENYKLSCQDDVRVEVVGGRKHLTLHFSLGEVWSNPLQVQMKRAVAVLCLFCIPFFPKGDLKRVKLYVRA